ncbi:unnamed protein product [Ostreobium quekettii]|uniref:Uncharacterized protein n=1 Tax=Ostreobium quekettii TaxID=121088 RepID=A0A8S1IX25_9CHLO|nr:unnamed protein product [Ostreobium quekettii]|eukprot:evm.model.scf_1226.2 EVM.evm.TU.scf_1226.2   scf_1226:21569-24009(-)
MWQAEFARGVAQGHEDFDTVPAVDSAPAGDAEAGGGPGSRVGSLWRMMAWAIGQVAGSAEEIVGAASAGGGGRPDGAVGMRPASSIGSASVTDDAAWTSEERWRCVGGSPWSMKGGGSCEGWEEVRWSQACDGDQAPGSEDFIRAAAPTPEVGLDAWVGVGGRGWDRQRGGWRLADLDRHLMRLEAGEDDSEIGDGAPAPLGRKSAPPGCCRFDRRPIEAWDAWECEECDESAGSQVSEGIFVKERRTALDAMELKAELRRRELLWRVAREEEALAGIREGVRVRKREFRLLKTGMQAETPEVARLRRRWGSGRRARRRRRREQDRQREEDDLADVPLTRTKWNSISQFATPEKSRTQTPAVFDWAPY